MGKRGGKGERSIRELVELLVMASAVIFRRGEFGREERIDEGGLSQT
jgi:hypothetical protein